MDLALGLASGVYARRGRNMQIAARTSKGKNASTIRTIAPPITGRSNLSAL